MLFESVPLGVVLFALIPFGAELVVTALGVAEGFAEVLETAAVAVASCWLRRPALCDGVSLLTLS